MLVFSSNYLVIAKIKTLTMFHNHTVGFNTDSLIIKSAQHTSQSTIFLTNYILHFGIVIQASDVRNHYEKLKRQFADYKIHMHQSKKEPLLPMHITLINKIIFFLPLSIESSLLEPTGHEEDEATRNLCPWLSSRAEWT